MKRPIKILVTTLLFSACSDRYEYFEGLNKPPSLQFIDKNRLTDQLIDSVKKVENSFYPITLHLTDSTSQVASLRYQVSSGKGKLYYKNEPVQVPNLNTANKTLTLRWIPEGTGQHQIVFTAVDRFKKEKKALLELLIFDNLDPVPAINLIPLRQESDLEYLIDGSASYDQDRRWGGYIKLYEFKIGSHRITTKASSFKFIFPMPGSYEIELTVTDNQGKSSSPLLKTINIINE